MFHVQPAHLGSVFAVPVSLPAAVPCEASLGVTSECYVMSNGSPRLGQVEPRERAGAQTGRKYEYQYERTARATLDLLADDNQHVCVYCDWHDDYVVEIGQLPTRYVFHQVKGRKSSQGPWKFGEFFGVHMKKAAKPAKNAPAVSPDAILPRMLLHHRNFGDSCAGLAFVTNAGLDTALSNFLQAIANAPDVAHLPDEVHIAFQHVACGYAATKPPLISSETDLFMWLRGLLAHTDRGQLDDQGAALLELADLVVNYSEVELLQRQAKQIAREIVNQVRRKVAHSTTVVPASDEQLRRDKGLVITEILSVLSLSTQALRAVKGGRRPGYGQDIVTTTKVLPRPWHGRRNSAHLRVQGALGHMADDRAAFCEQRRLHAFGKARERAFDDGAHAAKGDRGGEGHRETIPEPHRRAADARARHGTDILLSGAG